MSASGRGKLVSSVLGEAEDVAAAASASDTPPPPLAEEDEAESWK